MCVSVPVRFGCEMRVDIAHQRCAKLLFLFPVSFRSPSVYETQSISPALTTRVGNYHDIRLLGFKAYAIGQSELLSVSVLASAGVHDHDRISCDTTQHV